MDNTLHPTTGDLYDRASMLENNQILAIWNALLNYDPSEEYSPGIPMDAWAEIIYMEMCYRGIPRD